MKYKFTSLFSETTKRDVIEIRSYVAYELIELFETDYINEYMALRSDGGTDQISTQLEETLYDRKILADAEFDELSFLQNEYKKMQDERLTITIMPTEKCNLRCVYCYESFDNSELSEKDYELIFQEIQNKVAGGVKRVDISWFGGEPLLKVDSIIDFNERLIQYANENDVEYGMGITTNGVLLDAITFEKLCESGLYSYQITLDGFAHDSQRIFTNKKGSFDIVYRNIIQMLETDLDFHLAVRVNIAAGDFDLSFYDLFDKYAGDKRLHILTRTVGNYGGKSANLPIYRDKQEIDDVLGYHNNYLSARGHNIKDDFNFALFKNVCYASQKNAFIARANGRLNKCTIALDKEYNDIGYLDHIANRAIFFSDKDEKWTNNQLSEACKNCTKVAQCGNARCPIGKITNPEIDRCCV